MDVYRQFMEKKVPQEVRELAWCIGSPPLIDTSHQLFADRAVSQAWCDERFVRFLPHLINLERDPTPLLSWCATRPNKRLGRYFETLVSYWLHHAPGITKVRQSVQLKDRSQTVGEFDFLYFDEVAQRYFHLEVAVKFYLKYGHGESLSDYVGPSGIDRLDLKIQLLFQKQLLLGKSDPGLKLIDEIYGCTDLTPLAFVKGMIFEPFAKMSQFRTSLAQGISAECLRGSWLTLTSLTTLTRANPTWRWCIIPRLKWLSPNLSASSDEALRSDATLTLIDRHFESHKDPVMLGILKYNQHKSSWLEFARVFVLKEEPVSALKN